MTALDELGKMMGAPEEALQEVRRFDHTTAKIDDYLQGLTDSASARRMLYDSIRIASADVYAETEHLAAVRAAKILGVEPSVLAAIEGLVKLETTLRELRATLLTVNQPEGQ